MVPKSEPAFLSNLLTYLNEATVNYSLAICDLSPERLQLRIQGNLFQNTKTQACLVRFLADLFNPGQETESEIQPNPMQTPSL